MPTCDSGSRGRLTRAERLRLWQDDYDTHYGDDPDPGRQDPGPMWLIVVCVLGFAVVAGLSAGYLLS